LQLDVIRNIWSIEESTSSYKSARLLTLLLGLYRLRAYIYALLLHLPSHKTTSSLLKAATYILQLQSVYSQLLTAPFVKADSKEIMASQDIECHRAGAEVFTGDTTCRKKSVELLEEFGIPKGLVPLEDIQEFGYNRDSGFIWLV
jgi:hypothetical protein